MRFPCFDLLDRHVVEGYADDVALRSGPSSWTYARLLEEVSAFGGVLRHWGVTEGTDVAVALPASPEAVIAVLAAARLGARPHRADQVAARVLVTTSAEVEVLRSTAAEVVVVKQRDGQPRELREPRELDWEAVMRAGRTDPAPLAPDAALESDDPSVQAWAAALLARRAVDLTA